MTDDRINLPSGMGGLMRYFDEYKSKIQLKPEHIVVLIAIFIIIEVILKL